METKSRPEFPRVLDATMIRAFRSCPHSFFLEFLLGLRSAYPSIHLHAGKTFARGMEVYRLCYYGKKLEPRKCMIEAAKAMIREWGEEDLWEDNNKSLPNIILAVEASFDEYPAPSDKIVPFMVDDKPAVEFNFCLPIPGLFHPETGEPILYTGRFDMLAEYNNTLWVLDDKTATGIGPNWNKQWTLRSQFSGYCWGAIQYGKAVSGTIIRGTAMLKSEFKFAQSIQPKSKWEIDRWLSQTTRDIKRMISAWKEGYWDYNLDESCAQYGSCTYMGLCTKPNPEEWVKPDYKIEFWRPLEMSGAKIE